MILHQFYLNCLAHASYLIGDESSGVAAVVDPQRDVQQYLELAQARHLEIRHVILTHFHADFVAGHLELRDRTGATVYLGSRAQAEYAFVALGDGSVIELGDVRLEARETPGHTVESISLLVYDTRQDAVTPHAVLTGDTLFVGDVGRPDLRASLGWTADALGRLLYQSVRTKLLPLPDSTLVYPAHGAGSLCGKAISKETVSTIGDQRRSNYALQPMSEDDFLRIVTADQPDAPPYFTYDAVQNSRERPTLEVALEHLHALSLDEFLALRDAGAQVLDARDAAEFARAHLKGSLNIGLNGQYATWAGTMLNQHDKVIIVAEPGRETEAALRLGRIGFDHVAGYLAGGMSAIEPRVDLCEGTDRELPLSVRRALQAAEPPRVIDVRAPAEWQAGHIAGSLNVPLNRLRDAIPGLPRDQPLILCCAGGYRSSIAASLLQQHGVRHIIELDGGMAAWQGAKLPMD
ncbi:MAG TPA: MBL fold metallo-hydrolase [Vicinamibacterales bacterium]|jgi:glyoxylase-like metal-dependent hydrolase (beta-lactamase superfamily II)/rhodanese-related sulfurtransferase